MNRSKIKYYSLFFRTRTEYAKLPLLENTAMYLFPLVEARLESKVSDASLTSDHPSYIVVGVLGF